MEDSGLETSSNSPIKKEDDDRIECSNSRHLDKILAVAINHVTKLADSHLTEGKSHFISRFTEVFKNTIQENVTVNGLPWVANKETLSTDEKEEQKQETKDALLSKLSNALENTAHKRKHTPKQCSRVYSMQLKHERQNLKKAKIEHCVSIPTASFPSSSYSDRTEELVTVCESMTSAKRNIQEQEEKLHEIQEKIKFIDNIVKQQKSHFEPLYDTGYMSE
ncbi:uncharacterized protein TNIN_63881 [Trichonephila inaurata madagascariensis]|uniref:Uncharacterized protein n=1 Tax=Trichonephila inaurata madagascariensis TaxID=2747483 RepID=A0A8X6YK84_9ARAC|nr:uncharacterized protein TNIN_63881 [Trichonephila inaurata madagascariensis]